MIDRELFHCMRDYSGRVLVAPLCRVLAIVIVLVDVSVADFHGEEEAEQAVFLEL